MSDIDKLLQSLEGVQSIKTQKHAASFIALCPAHNDKRPSLCIDEAQNGRILLYCRFGCTTVDVLNSLGMTMRELFPCNAWQRPPGPKQEEIDHAHTILEIANSDLKAKRKHSARDIASIKQAISTPKRSKRGVSIICQATKGR